MDMKNYAALASFGPETFKTCFSKDENVLISPLSLTLALAMVLNGAEGETQEEMLKVISGGLSEDEFNTFLSEYVKGLPSDEKAKFHFADSLWMNEDLKVKKRFIKNCEDFYNAEVKKVFFDENAVREINAWVSEHTDGMIDQVIESAAPEAIMYLINALAFDAEWERLYTVDDVREGEFTDIYGEKAPVTYLNSEENYYIENEKCTGFVKLYKGNRFAFLALLPAETADLEAFIRSLTGETLLLLLASAKNTPCICSLPKFKEDWSAIMNDVFRAIGLEKTFSDQAELSGIVKKMTSLGDVIHKTHIEVDERGTKAGAVTAIMLKALGLPVEKPEVRLDRPFVYAIVDKDTGVPMFIGQKVLA
ncbi:MAG: serpin family protein [Lachnospiraceae bacterium]|nr:serpin family protein [Lachnospiraceae bacterium]